jgi:hypothetical protein
VLCYGKGLYRPWGWPLAMECYGGGTYQVSAYWNFYNVINFLLEILVVFYSLWLYLKTSQQGGHSKRRPPNPKKRKNGPC